MRYVEEALQGQLADAAKRAGAEPPAGGPQTWEAVREQIQEMVKGAVLKAQAQPSEEAAQSPQAIVDVVGRLMGTQARRVPGAPQMPMQLVQGTRNGEPIGRCHEVLTYDPLLPQEAWITRCGWHFGLSEFAVPPSTESVTCKRCRRGNLADGAQGGAGEERR